MQACSCGLQCIMKMADMVLLSQRPSSREHRGKPPQTAFLVHLNLNSAHFNHAFTDMFAPPAATFSPHQLYLAAAACFTITAISAILALTTFICPFSNNLLRLNSISWNDECTSLICGTQHYLYMIPLLVPVTAWFAIANWVGWEYFRYA